MTAAGTFKVDTPEMMKPASAGITTVLSTPGGGLIQGQSALVNVLRRWTSRRSATVAETRRGQNIVRTPVALHVTLSGRRDDAGRIRSRCSA